MFYNTDMIATEVARLKKEYKLETYEAIQIVQINSAVYLSEATEQVAKGTKLIADAIAQVLVPELPYVASGGLGEIANAIEGKYFGGDV